MQFKIVKIIETLSLGCFVLFNIYLLCTKFIYEVDKQNETIYYEADVTAMDSFKDARSDTYAIASDIDTKYIGIQENVCDIVSTPIYSDIVIPSVSIEVCGGKVYDTEELICDPAGIAKNLLYPDTGFSYDPKHKNKEISVLWDFLVNENNVKPEIAASLIGNICCEGYFGQMQGTDYRFEGIQNVHNVIGYQGTGFGIVQWTSSFRKQSMIKYYNEVYELLKDYYDWETIMAIAESACLFSEVTGYGCIASCSNISTGDTYRDIMSYTGLIACRYESYEGCSNEWSNSGDLYVLNQSGGSGSERLKYAWSIYSYYMQ